MWILWRFVSCNLSSPFLFVVLYLSILLAAHVLYIVLSKRCRGVYLGQDVAVKVLKPEHLNEALEAEFAQEVTILRLVAW